MAGVTATDVQTYLGDSDAPAADVLPLVTAFVRSYVRGAGFWDSGGNPPVTTVADDLRAVIISAASRELNIRDKLGLQREEIAGYSAYLGPGASDFTARELAVMNDWRRRAT